MYCLYVVTIVSANKQVTDLHPTPVLTTVLIWLGSLSISTLIASSVGALSSLSVRDLSWSAGSNCPGPFFWATTIDILVGSIPVRMLETGWPLANLCWLRSCLSPLSICVVAIHPRSGWIALRAHISFSYPPIRKGSFQYWRYHVLPKPDFLCIWVLSSTWSCQGAWDVSNLLRRLWSVLPLSCPKWCEPMVCRSRLIRRKNQMWPCFWCPFFNRRPCGFDPSCNCFLVAFPSSPLRLLARKSETFECMPDWPIFVWNSSLFLDVIC